METLKSSKDDLLDDFKDINLKPKNNYNYKLIISSVIIALCILGIIIMIIFLVIQSKKINKLTNQIKELNNQYDKDIPYLKNKTNDLLNLNDRLIKTESELIEKENEINQKIANLNRLMNENIDNIQMDLRNKDEEIKLLKNTSNTLSNSNLILNDNIDKIKNDLLQKNKEIGISSNNINLLNDRIKNNDIRLNRNFAEIQGYKNIATNMALLVNFKVRIKADFYIGNQQAQLCSHKNGASDIIDDSRIKLCGYQKGDSGCVWIVYQNAKFLEFTLTDSKFNMNNWKIEVKNDSAYCTNKTIGSIFILEVGTLYKYHKIKNKETGQYLFINPDNKRSDTSYFVDLTTSKERATDFYFEIYHE